MYKVTCRVVKVNEPKPIEGEETIPKSKRKLVTVDGQLVLDMGGSLGIDDNLVDRNLTFRFEGTCTSRSETIASTVQMRTVGIDRLEVPLQVSDGTIVAWIDVKGNVGIRDRDTNWSCDPQALTCTRSR